MAAGNGRGGTRWSDSAHRPQFFCGWHAARDRAGVDVYADDAEVAAELRELRRGGVWPLDTVVRVVTERRPGGGGR